MERERERDHKQEKNKSTDFMPTIRRLFIYGGKHLRLIKGILCGDVYRFITNSIEYN